MLNDPGIYPDASMMKKLYTVGARDPRAQRLLNRLWTRLMTGE